MASLDNFEFECVNDQAECSPYSTAKYVRKNVTVVSVLAPNRIVVKDIVSGALEDKYISLQKNLETAWKTRAKFTEDNQPYAGMHVMVRNREWEGICRAVIREKLPNRENTQYSVFMYDIGKIDILTEVNMAPMPSEWRLILTSRSYSLHVVGIVPSRLHTDLNVMLNNTGSSGAQPKYVEAGAWSGASLKFVKKWVTMGDFAVIIYKSLDNAIKLGDICCRKRSDSSDIQQELLSESLVNSNYALLNTAMADKQLSHELFDPQSMDDSTENYQKSRSKKCDQSSAAKNASTLQDDPMDVEEINQKSSLFQNFKQNQEISESDNIPENANTSSSGRKIVITNESKISTPVGEVKNKRYTRFAPVKDIGTSRASVANNEGNKNNTRFSCSEIPAARSIVNIADVPGRTLVRGIDIQPPLTSFSKFSLFSPIQKGWENMGLEEGNELQKGVWPNIAKGHDVFIIGGSKNGKSLAYIAPICSDLLINSGVPKKASCTGPICVILCSSTDSGNKIAPYGEALLRCQNMNQMQCQFINEDYRSARSRQKGEIDLLITTVETLLMSQKKYAPTFMFDRIRYLVFDDAHKLLKENRSGVMKIIDEYKDYLCKQNANSQLIVCGNEWTPEIEELYWTFSQRPTVHIGSANQAMVYSGIDLKVHHTPADIDLTTLADLLKRSTDTHKRIVVVCASEQSANFVQQELQNRYGVFAHLAIDLAREKLQSISMLWRDASDDTQQVLVCIDQVLKDSNLNITNATSLIHYELKDSNAGSTKSATLFSRISCMWSHLRDITAQPVMVPWNERSRFGKKLSSDIFISGKEENLDRIVAALKKIGVDIPPAIDINAAMVNATKMEKTELCLGVKMFGWCDIAGLNTCPKRHNFLKKEIDKTPTLPRSGQVELLVVECKNPSRYICQIIRYYPMKNEGGSIYYPGKLKEYKEKLKQHYQLRENRVQPKSFRTGSLCVVTLANDEGYCRAEVVNVMTYTSTGAPNAVKLYCIDTGELITRNVYDGIYSLPSDIADLPRLCVEVILNGLKPLKNEKEYNITQSGFARSFTENTIYLGKIVCSIDNTVWLNPLVETKIENGKVVTYNSVRLRILHRKMAEINSQHENAIVDLCRKADYPMIEFPDKCGVISNITSNSTFFQQQDEYSWAYMPISRLTTPEEATLSIVFVQNPWLVYGNLVKFVDLLDNLNADINEEVESTKESIIHEYRDQFDAYFEVGMVVLALLPSDEKWYRAMIMDKGNEDEVTYYTVFFVDFGDTVDDATSKTLLPIPKKFVERLPFQIIAINASHVSPKEENHDYKGYDPWSKESVDFLFDKLIPEGDAQDVTVVAFEKDVESESETVPCKYYCGFMFLTDGNEVGESLVLQGYAEFTRCGENNFKKVKDSLLTLYNSKFDEKNAMDIDDDDEDSYYDSQPIEDSTNEPQTAYPDGFFDDEEFDVYVPNAEEPLQQLGISPNHLRHYVCENLAAASIKENESHRSIENETVAVKCASDQGQKNEIPVKSPNSANVVGDGWKHPKTFWSQTTDEVCLKIDMPDISDYTLTLAKNRKTISFRTIEPPGYGFDIDSFGTLKNPQEFLTGQYLRVKFEKRISEIVWPTFVKDQGLKLPWLKEELQFGDDSDEEDDDKPPLIPVDYEKMFPESGSSDSDDFTDAEDLDDFDVEDYKCTKVPGLSRQVGTMPM